MRKVSLESRSGWIALVDEQGRVLKSTLWDCDYLRQWAEEHGYQMALGSQMDVTSYSEESFDECGG